VAVDTAASIGYDRDAIREGKQKAETKDRLVFENEEAIRRDVFGSPLLHHGSHSGGRPDVVADAR
jgi:2-hydroxychromene-2-carboxylate isomerase